ncbi:MAG: tRNA dihydrouridine synthase DusB [Eggerthellales bacterium]|nr:tRNA dihydrouridine synthase DusB [Eggerthellales bacterium]
MQDYFKTHQLLLAPMAGVTDEALRTLCLEQGADVTYTEMVSAKALSFANQKTRHLLNMAEGEDQVAVQIFGHEPEVMAREAAWVAQTMGQKLAYLDVNMGCPARKIAGKGDGSALMKDPELAARIIASICAAVPDVPVTCKFRRGYYQDQETAPEFAKRMEQAGAAAVAVHGRFVQQMYNGSADWGVISRVREAVSVPVIGNGDVRSGADALRMVRETGCHAVMIARAAEGNPWIFAQAKAALAGQPEPPKPTLDERVAMARRHAWLLSQREGKNLVRMRKHAAWYMTGLPGASVARGKFNQCVTLEDFNAVFDELLAYAHQFLEAHGSASCAPQAQGSTDL